MTQTRALAIDSPQPDHKRRSGRLSAGSGSDSQPVARNVGVNRLLGRRLRRSCTAQVGGSSKSKSQTGPLRGSEFGPAPADLGGPRL